MSYRTGFVKRHVNVDASGMRLTITREPTQHHRNAGAELERRGFFHYGRYEVVMQPAKGSGLVSSFFTHTFPLFGDPHDEIDIEFLGNRTHLISINYFTGAEPYGPFEMDLGFDAADAPHLYAFDWRPDRIDWFVDGKRLHSATGDKLPLPSAAGRIMMNLWTGAPGLYKWHGEPTFADGSQALYHCVSFQAAGTDTQQCSDTFIANEVR
jgi:beta-glucanase (GH16 family)